jgi:ribosomal protein L18E
MANEPSLGQVFQVLLDIKGDVGGLKTSAEQNQAHTLAVSRKVDAVRSELDAHKQDTTAHGAGVQQRVEETVEARQEKRSEITVGKIAVAIAAVELLVHVAEPLVRSALAVKP